VRGHARWSPVGVGLVPGAAFRDVEHEGVTTYVRDQGWYRNEVVGAGDVDDASGVVLQAVAVAVDAVACLDEG